MSGLLRDIGIALVAVAYVYLRWKSIERAYTRDLGDGRIQTLFSKEKSK